MIKQKITPLILLLFVLSACSKKNKNDNNNNNNNAPAKLVWTYKGVTHFGTLPRIDTNINHILHEMQPDNNSIEIFTTSLAIGSYMADSGCVTNGAVVTYVQNDTIFMQLTPAGVIHILQNNNAGVTGDFNLTTTDGQQLVGYFTNLPLSDF